LQMQGAAPAENKSVAAANPLWRSCCKHYVFADTLSDELRGAFRDAERLLAGADLIKNSRSTTAGIFSLNGKKYFIKRSNATGWFERLRRCGRLSRAERNWKMAAELQKIGVRTPEVYMALATGKFLPGACYLITENLEPPMNIAQNLVEMLNFYRQPEALFKEICRLAFKLHENGFLHGDLKLSNFLALRQADGSFELGLFDLDGSVKLSCKASEFKRIKELARMASSYLHCALYQNLVGKEDIASILRQWAEAYQAVGGRDYSENPQYLRRAEKFLKVYNRL